MPIKLGKILLFGDSITELSTEPEYGFNLTPALQTAYRRKLDVINRGFGGYTTEHAIHIFEPILDGLGDSKIELVVIFLGTNDSFYGGPRYVTIERYIENLEYMVNAARKRDIRIILVGPGANIELPDRPGRQTLLKRKYGQAAKQLAEKYNLGFIDLWQTFVESTGFKEGSGLLYPGQLGADPELTAKLESLTTDGVHFSGDGYRLWYRELIAEINRVYPEISPDKIPQILVRPEGYEGLRDALLNTGDPRVSP